jgi:hypothetical protein
MKPRNKVEIEFTEDFATKKKGERAEYELQLASSLVKRLKVAKYFVEVKKPKAKAKPKVKPES